MLAIAGLILLTPPPFLNSLEAEYTLLLLKRARGVWNSLVTD